jgi:Ca2+-transporting ATPase
LHAISARSETHSVFDHERLKNNPWLPIALSGTVLLQLAATLVPGLRALLGTVPLQSRDFGVTLVSAALPLLLNETSKLALRDKPPGARHAD